MPDPVKRLNYFDTQFLRAKDFNDEQLYHLSMRRLLTSLLHNWGILQGLKISFSSGKTAVSISAGVAIDRDGKELVLAGDSALELREKLPSGSAGSLYVTIQYGETQTDPSTDGGSGQTRWTEQPSINVDSSTPVDSSRKLVLGKLTGTKEGGIIALDESDRQAAGALLPDNLQVNSLALKSGPDSTKWPKLFADNNGQANFSSGLAVNGTLSATGDASVHDLHAQLITASKLGIGVANPPQQLSITGGIGFANQNAADKKLYSPVDGVLEWMTHEQAGQHGFAISHQGQQRAFINTNGNSYLNGGNVGIGTATPQAKLEVAGDVAITGNISCDHIIEKNPRPGPTPTTGDLIRKDVPKGLGPILTIANAGGGKGAAGAIDFRTYDAGGPNAPPLRIESIDDDDFSNHLVFFSKKPGAAVNPLVESMRLTSAGNLGIGVTAPVEKLHVEAGNIFLNGENQGVIVDAQGLQRTGFMKYPNQESMLVGDSQLPVPVRLGRFTGGTIKIPKAISDDLIISSTGNVGVGLTSPDRNLTIYKAGVGTGVYENVKNDKHEILIGVDATAIVSAMTNSDLQLRTNNLTRAVISAGTGTLTAIADIRLANSDIYFTKTDHNHTGFGNTPGFAAIENTASHNGLMILGRQTTSGRVVRLWDFLQINGNLEVTGGASKPGGGTWTAPSDKRLKENINPLSGVLDKLLALRGVTFEWKEPEKFGNLVGTQVGLIAQEVEQVFPEWVGVDSEGFKTITVRGLEAMAIEAFREIKQEINALKDAVAGIQARLGVEANEQKPTEKPAKPSARKSDSGQKK